MVSGDQLFQQFLRERTYLKNVTPKTREWYESAWKAFKSTQGDGEAWPLTKPLLQTFIVRLRERGVRPVSCNTWLKALNAFGAWLYEQGQLAQPVALASLRVEKRIIPTLDDPALSRLLAFKPRTFAEWRIYTLDCTILDTGCRIQELLSARVQDFDLDNLLLTVNGKGNKERKVPFGFELRKLLVRYEKVRDRVGCGQPLVFCTRRGGRVTQRNALRSHYILLGKVGLPKCGFHRLRHTFATQYLRHGGDVVRLSKILGHTQVTTTMRYLHLLTEDLQAPHQQLSILNRLR